MKKGKAAFIVTILLVAVIYYVSVKENTIPIDKTKEIQAIVDDTSHGKVQVDWRNVAAVAQIEYGIQSVSKQEIESIAALFIEERDNDYILKDIDQVTKDKNYNQEQKQRVEAFFKQLDDEMNTAAINNQKTMQRDFIKEMEEAAISNYKTHNILPSITIAQAILESDWGRSTLSSQYNNYFGIKSHNWHGDSANLTTKEFHNQTIKDDFRVYNNLNESVADHGEFLSTHSRYEKNGLFSANTYMEQSMALQAAGYSTIENEHGEKIYSKQLVEIIQQHQLQLIDSQAQLKHG
ncbi:glycoside hydrolase family 73 protein [Cytobacillus purgationiresistens]|uniref:Flagellum-specific peptidoglycan hydrolase FlgJ n=1 Tax=Cytobacillus purgationiresistens TaxID=863449 RepID=A0ABU0AH88_9BACI|nr:glucosaminidase domain-containing protein [Cytobacillus purgationiresistens]MDQ0270631.1 flagellum-specific peptidoglycan hydrolase FlgJ [Cytobacillus purgationiresistens]